MDVLVTQTLDDRNLQKQQVHNHGGLGIIHLWLGTIQPSLGQGGSHPSPSPLDLIGC
jgi:hypothetical protein